VLARLNRFNALIAFVMLLIFSTSSASGVLQGLGKTASGKSGLAAEKTHFGIFSGTPVSHLDISAASPHGHWGKSGCGYETALVSLFYTYGLDLIAQHQLMPVEAPDHWETSYYLYDGLGSVRALADETGLVTDAYFYDAYGRLLNIASTGDGTPNTYLFTGEQFDADLGMYYLRARYLNPETGRFHTMDSFEGRFSDPQTLHKYLYAHANPVMFVDPSGNFSLLESINNLVIRGMVWMSVRMPFTYRAMMLAFEAFVPAEVAVGLPTFGAAAGVSGLAVWRTSKELPALRALWNSNKLKAGNDFETWIGKIYNINKADVPVRDGLQMTRNVPGSAVIDYIFRGSVLEIKASEGAVKTGQLMELAEYASNNGLGLTYIFKIKPSPEKVKRMREIVDDIDPSLDLAINYLYKE